MRSSGKIIKREIVKPREDLPDSGICLIERRDLIVRASGGFQKQIVDGVSVDNPGIDIRDFTNDNLGLIDGVLVSYGQWRDHTFIVGLREILAEDLLWRADHPRVPALACFQDDNACECPWGCVMKLRDRVFWLFTSFPDLEQIMILFKRDEKDLRRRINIQTPYTPQETASGIAQPKEVVPRFWIMLICRDFRSMVVPWQFFRSNYDGLLHVLRGTKEMRIKVPLGFWTGDLDFS